METVPGRTFYPMIISLPFVDFFSISNTAISIGHILSDEVLFPAENIKADPDSFSLPRKICFFLPQI